MMPRPAGSRETDDVQSQEIYVEVVEGDDDGDAGRVIGQGVLVAPDVVVLALDDRASIPSLPLHVLVPVAAGGGRGEHLRERVIELEAAEEDLPLVAVRLERVAPVPVPEQVEPPASLRAALRWDAGAPGHRSGRARDRAQVHGLVGEGGSLAAADGWFCRVFPRLCR